MTRVSRLPSIAATSASVSWLHSLRTSPECVFQFSERRRQWVFCSLTGSRSLRPTPSSCRRGHARPTGRTGAPGAHGARPGGGAGARRGRRAAALAGRAGTGPGAAGCGGARNRWAGCPATSSCRIRSRPTRYPIRFRTGPTRVNREPRRTRGGGESGSLAHRMFLLKRVADARATLALPGPTSPFAVRSARRVERSDDPITR